MSSLESRPETGAPPLVPKRELPNWKGELTGNGSSWHPRRAPWTGLGNVQQWRRQVAVRLGSRRENGGHGPLLPLAEAYGRLCRTHPFRPMAQGRESACALRFASGSHYSLAHRPWRVAGRWGGRGTGTNVQSSRTFGKQFARPRTRPLGAVFLAWGIYRAGRGREPLGTQVTALRTRRLSFGVLRGGRRAAARQWNCARMDVPLYMLRVNPSFSGVPIRSATVALGRPSSLRR
ncbi:hypothetical protein H6P1_00358 (plasmid) [Variovorax sp. PBL-H6]|nr:hypothetical protein H6P1_00358 [Variovorax sp. PBL-H6]VTU43448.1 hypothetical protein SRS16P1_00547 [Variovorax sp. SRS16]VTU43513.1 hypothetical protein E5P1_00543 [Variovorax sp. PBL-E5]